MAPHKKAFIVDVLKFSLTAFGGAQAHIAMMHKKFVQEKKYVTAEELLEYNALTQILPGPSSTQTLVAIAYKFAGLRMAILAFFIWILPSAVIMTLFGIFYQKLNHFAQFGKIIEILKPMAIGFIAYSAYLLTAKVISSRFSIFLTLLSALTTIWMQNAYVFPSLLLVGIVGNYFFGKDFQQYAKEPLVFRWRKLLIFLGILLLFAGLGAIISRESYFSLPVRLFENFYRNGILIFGGGQVLVPLLYTEFVEMKMYLNTQEFLSGYALQQAIPGPIFAFTAYIGSMSLREQGTIAQALGGLAATLGINIPGFLFILMIFPTWEKLKQRKIVQRALLGIFSVSVGFAIASFFIMSSAITLNWQSGVIILATFLLLNFTRISATLLILAGVLLGMV